MPAVPSLPLEPPDNDQTDTPKPRHPSRRRGLVDPDRIPEYRGIRTKRYTYVEYVTGEHELYDIVKDPHELANIYSGLRHASRMGLAHEVAILADCAGPACRRNDALPAVALQFRRDRRPKSSTAGS